MALRNTAFVIKEIFLRRKLSFIFFRYRYLLRYILIGLGSLVFEILIITLLNGMHLLSEYNYVVILTGFVAGVLFAFALNAKINFPVPKNRNLRTFRVFLAISILAFVINLLLLEFILKPFIILDYSKLRFVTAAIVFMLSYTLHRRFTFVDIKNVGIAVYMKASENIPLIKSKTGFFPDFIHLDLVDKTYNSKAEDVDVSVGERVSKEWPLTKKMIHIMSKRPSEWIHKVQQYADFIIFHFENDENTDDLIKLCKSYKKKVGISIMHNTNVDPLIKYLKDIDVVQVLGINKPGESHQHFDPTALDKLSILNSLKDKYGFDICFDGGIRLSNIKQINAKYIVSGSTVLTAQDSKKAMYHLKTGARYYLGEDIDMKEFLNREIRNVLSSLDFVQSGTLVGSFPKSRGLEGVSDIDIVVIVDELNKKKFDKIVNEFSLLKDAIKADYGYDTIINTTFGPLKFNKEKTVVFHLMIYDIASHIEHCKQSPFTCLDWQTSRYFIKKPMTAFYKVSVLQPNHFFNARRSISEYMKDIQSDVVSFRQYKFTGNRVSEVKLMKKMDNRDHFEFMYHIMKYLMLNYIKLHYKENKDINNEKILEEYFSLSPSNKKRHVKYFEKLKEMKKSSSFPEWSEEYRNELKSFLLDFEIQFKERFDSNAKKLIFVRHQRTLLNKPNLFLGQKLDPGIISTKKHELRKISEKLGEVRIDKIYSSPLRRCLETVNLIKPQLGIDSIVVDDGIKEMNYGAMDGKSLDDLKKEYPEIVSGWKNKADPRFPQGENTHDVIQRVNHFLDACNENALVCSHNVIIRSLIGSQLGIPMHKWYKISVPHLEPIELIKTNHNYYLNLTKEQEDVIMSKVDLGDN